MRAICLVSVPPWSFLPTRATCRKSINFIACPVRAKIILLIIHVNNHTTKQFVYSWCFVYMIKHGPDCMNKYITDLAGPLMLVNSLIQNLSSQQVSAQRMPPKFRSLTASQSKTHTCSENSRSCYDGLNVSLYTT